MYFKSNRLAKQPLLPTGQPQPIGEDDDGNLLR